MGCHYQEEKALTKDNKIIRMPISYEQRKINEFGNGYVPCDVSERWLQFSDSGLKSGSVLVNVMTMGSDDKPKKICEMVLNKEDLLRALENVRFDQ